MTNPAHGCTITGDTGRARENFYGARTLLKKIMQNLPENFPKNF